MICKIDHLVITTPQPKACLAFYEKLGFTPRDAGGRYELHAGDFKINVHILGSELQPHAGRVQPGSADLCFEVEGDLEAFKADIEAKGLCVALGIVERNGVKGPMRSLYLQDPDDNLVEFCCYGQ